MANFKNVSTGTIAANGGSVEHELRLTSPGEFSIQLSGTFSGTIAFEATLDGTNWVAVAIKSAAETTGTTLVASATGVGIFSGHGFGLKGLRARATAWTSGTATVNFASVSN
jgi:hypothetical protein